MYDKVKAVMVICCYGNMLLSFDFHEVRLIYAAVATFDSNNACYLSRKFSVHAIYQCNDI